METELLVRLNVGVRPDVWRRLRDLAEERKDRGKKASVEAVVRHILAEALNLDAERAPTA